MFSLLPRPYLTLTLTLTLTLSLSLTPAPAQVEQPPGNREQRCWGVFSLLPHPYPYSPSPFLAPLLLPRLSSHLAIMDSAAGELVKRLAGPAGAAGGTERQQVVDVAEQIGHMTMEVIGMTAFG